MIDEKLRQRAFNPPSKGDPVPREKILSWARKSPTWCPTSSKG